jgi:hypothetical protein
VILRRQARVEQRAIGEAGPVAQPIACCGEVGGISRRGDGPALSVDAARCNRRPSLQSLSGDVAPGFIQ